MSLTFFSASPIRSRSLFVAASFVGLIVLVPACSDPYHLIVGNCDDPNPERWTAYTCDGNALVQTSYRDGDNHAQCEASEVSRTDCSQASRACVASTDLAAACQTVCTSNSDCASTQYCSEDQSLNGYRVCRAFIQQHDSCAADPTHCAPGFSCIPHDYVPDAGVDAATDAATDAAAADAGPPLVDGYTCERP